MRKSIRTKFKKALSIQAMNNEKNTMLNQSNYRRTATIAPAGAPAAATVNIRHDLPPCVQRVVRQLIDGEKDSISRWDVYRRTQAIERELLRLGRYEEWMGDLLDLLNDLAEESI